jgi:glycosyltransferase involved in cell wall biosynthesis
MVLGKAVIGSRIGGIPELVIDGQTGATFNPGDVDDLKNKIELLLSNKGRLKEYGNNAREHVTKMVNFESHYKTMEIIFKKIQRN